MDEEEIGTINHPIGTTMMRRDFSHEGTVDTRGDFAYAPPRSCVNEEEPSVKGNISNHEINYVVSSNAQYCYSLLEAMPLPGPTWSTTAPSLLAGQPSAPIEASVMEEGEFGENQGSSSSYTWWLGYLEGLDGNSFVDSEKLLEYPFVEDSNKVLISNESPFVDEMDLGFFPDDWLMIPTMEKDLAEFGYALGSYWFLD